MNASDKVHPEIVLVRHGETEWSAAGKHTGTSDVPLTESGREVARRLGERLADREFAVVWTSPRSRAKETCDLAGFGSRAEVVDDIVEWSYGEYEGRTTAEIHLERPGWTVWNGGSPGGEDVADVGARADRALQRLRALLMEGGAPGALPMEDRMPGAAPMGSRAQGAVPMESHAQSAVPVESRAQSAALMESRARSALRGDALLFSHGHFLRVLAARWIGFVPEKGARFALSTGAISVLGWERETPVIRLWNDVVGPV